MLAAFLSRVLDTLTYSNVYIAFSAFLFTLQTGFVFQQSFRSALFFGMINFVATMGMYSLQRVYFIRKRPFHPVSKWFKTYGKWVLVIILLLASLHISWFGSFYKTFLKGLFLYAPVVLLSLAYFLPPFNLRSLPYVKIFFIGLVWMYVGIIIPLSYNGFEFYPGALLTKEALSYVIAQFLFISAICIPFDVRDFESDKLNNILTIPVQFGIKVARWLGIIILAGYFLLAADEVQLYVYMLCTVVASILIWFSYPIRKRHYYSVLVDGLIIFQYALFYALL